MNHFYYITFVIEFLLSVTYYKNIINVVQTELIIEDKHN